MILFGSQFFFSIEETLVPTPKEPMRVIHIGKHDKLRFPASFVVLLICHMDLLFLLRLGCKSFYRL